MVVTCCYLVFVSCNRMLKYNIMDFSQTRLIVFVHPLFFIGLSRAVKFAVLNNWLNHGNQKVVAVLVMIC